MSKEMIGDRNSDTGLHRITVERTVSPSYEGTLMRTILRDTIRQIALLVTFVVIPSLLSSQTPQPKPATPLPEDNIAPAEFTVMLKEAWTFTKDESENYANAIGKKTEFETTAEFEKRSVVARQQYLAKLAKYFKDKKFDQRVIGVVLKADLNQYDADNQVYSVSCPSVIEAPYNIPTVTTEIAQNAYVGLADTIRMGYRTSSIYLKFNPYFRWQVGRDIAKATKDDEANIFFRIRFKVDMSQGEARKGSRFAVSAKQVMLFNQRTNTVYWEQTIR